MLDYAGALRGRGGGGKGLSSYKMKLRNYQSVRENFLQINCQTMLFDWYVCKAYKCEISVSCKRSTGPVTDN